MSASRDQVPQPYTSPPGLSCIRCRKRKVKCDKAIPCSGCVRSKIECAYATRRESRRPRWQNDLVSKLTRLEGVVQQLSGMVDGKAPPEETGSINRIQNLNDQHGNNSIASDAKGGLVTGGVDVFREFGKLVITEGKGQYINSNFWATLTNELADVRDQFDNEWDEEETSPSAAESSPQSPPDSDLQAFVFGHSSSSVDLHSMHPLPSQVMFYWEKYLENVEPLTKLLHAPTTANILSQGKDNLKMLDGPSEALMFSVYHATVTSMSEEEVKTNFGVERELLLRKYRFATEQALARADFLRTSEIITVQAFVLYISIIRDIDTRTLWALVGMILRLSYALGLHRDGTVLGLSPYDAEIRRRIWFHICTLDIRASDALGSTTSVGIDSFDTKLPLNLNDEDLSPQMTELPEPRVGLTGMTFVLIRYEINKTERRLAQESLRGTSVEDKENIVKQLSGHLETTYFQYCDQAGPVCIHAASLSRLVISNLSLINFGLTGRSGGNTVDTLSPPVKDRLFRTCIESVEYMRFMGITEITKKYKWLFNNQVQWFAIAYILREIGLRENSELVERGWEVVDSVFKGWGSDGPPDKQNKTLWNLIRKLLINAKREMATHQLSTTKQSDVTDQPEDVDTILQSSAVVFPTQAESFSDEQQSRFPLAGGVPWDNAWVTKDPHQISAGISSQGLASESSMAREMGYGISFENPTKQHQNVPWFVDDNALVNPDMGHLDQDLPFESWDDMVRDFNMDVDAKTPVALGGVKTPSYW